MGRLEDKVAIITGAASGQGAEEARLFAKEGAKVVATDIQTELLESVVKEINANGGEAIGLKLDVSVQEDWKNVVEKAVETFGKVNILVNNAAFTGNLTQTIEEQDEETWCKILDINTKGPFLGIKTVIPEMKKAGGGSIVNISSLSSVIGIGNAAYNSSKGGVRSLTNNTAYDYAKHNIRVNTILPGTIETPMIKDFMNNPEVRDLALSGIPLNVLGQPSDIAYGVLYLASDESKFVTGAELVIDGGALLL